MLIVVFYSLPSSGDAVTTLTTVSDKSSFAIAPFKFDGIKFSGDGGAFDGDGVGDNEPGPEFNHPYEAVGVLLPMAHSFQ